jgi:hypothetical protein
MTELLLKKGSSGWTRVFFESSNGFKLTKENPYFTQSETYTLDVTLPMSILQNRKFFQNIHRIDKKKMTEIMKCRLIVDNKILVDGSAKMTQVTETTVKLQLLGGKSELNFLSNENKTYIDEMPLGYFFFGICHYYNGEIGDGEKDGVATFMSAYDETNDWMVNKKSYALNAKKWLSAASFKEVSTAIQPNLLYIIKGVVALSGYEIERCDFDCEPWSRLFIASVKATRYMGHTLPHWLVNEFTDEVCKFFNCTLIVDSEQKKVSFISNHDFFKSASRIHIEPVDEYTSDMTDSEDTQALAAANIGYSLSSSKEHTLDCLTDELRKSIPRRECSSKNDAEAQYAALEENERLKFLYVCPTGKYVGWAKEEGSPVLTKVEHFAPLVRDDSSDSAIELKICPVALKESEEALWYGYPDYRSPRMKCIVATLENPTGSESGYGNEDATAQDLIEGNTEIESAEKEDRLQVMFVDDRPQDAIVSDGEDKGKAIPLLMPFTDCDHLHQGSVAHRPWSLSLNKSDASYYLGKIHNSSLTFNVKAKTTIKFISDHFPDPTAIYIIRGKMFGCEKIEAHVTEKGFDKLMTGYFYEMYL